jgi:hypothetical protein
LTFIPFLTSLPLPAPRNASSHNKKIQTSFRDVSNSGSLTLITLTTPSANTGFLKWSVTSMLLSTRPMADFWLWPMISRKSSFILKAWPTEASHHNKKCSSGPTR